MRITPGFCIGLLYQKARKLKRMLIPRKMTLGGSDSFLIGGSALTSAASAIHCFAFEHSLTNM